MKVYVVYNNINTDGCVSAIFDTECKALDFVIKEHYSCPYYNNIVLFSLYIHIHIAIYNP